MSMTLGFIVFRVFRVINLSPSYYGFQLSNNENNKGELPFFTSKFEKLVCLKTKLLLIFTKSDA